MSLYVSSGHFTYETQIRNDYAVGSAACQHTELRILCQDNTFAIPLSQPGCVSGLTLHLVDQYVVGTQSDLSAFGCAVNEWVKVRCEVRQKTVRIWINDKLAIQRQFLAEAGNIVGLCYRFQGAGSVRSVRLNDQQGRPVIQQSF